MTTSNVPMTPSTTPADLSHATQLPYPHLWNSPGIVYDIREVNEEAYLVRIRIAVYGVFVDVCQLLSEGLLEALNGKMVLRSLDLLLSGPKPQKVPYLVGYEVEEDSEQTLFDHLPDSLCPIPGTLSGIADLVAQVSTPPLQRFLVSVFARRDVTPDFWTMPAAATYHHARRGGLAQHSLEVALDLSMSRGLTSHERDLGIAGALLHDIGKVWSYDNNTHLNAAAVALGHEQLGLTRIEPELKELENEWTDGALALRAILSGQSRMRANGSLPTSLLARIKACDQRSCEQDKARQGQKKFGQVQVWIPKPWANECGEENGDPD